MKTGNKVYELNVYYPVDDPEFGNGDWCTNDDKITRAAQSEVVGAGVGWGGDRDLCYWYETLALRDAAMKRIRELGIKGLRFHRCVIEGEVV